MSLKRDTDANVDQYPSSSLTKAFSVDSCDADHLFGPVSESWRSRPVVMCSRCEGRSYQYLTLTEDKSEEEIIILSDVSAARLTSWKYFKPLWS